MARDKEAAPALHREFLLYSFDDFSLEIKRSSFSLRLYFCDSSFHDDYWSIRTSYSHDKSERKEYCNSRHVRNMKKKKLLFRND